MDSILKKRIADSGLAALGLALIMKPLGELPALFAIALFGLSAEQINSAFVWPVLIACILAIVGGIAVVALTSGEGHAGTSRPGTAMLWSAAGTVGFATTFWFAQESARLGGEWPAILLPRLVALVLVAGLAVMNRSPVGQLGGSGRWLVMMGVLDAFAIGLVTASASLPNPEYAAISSSLFGVLTILLAWRILKERVAPMQWAGIVTVFVGIAVLSSQG